MTSSDAERISQLVTKHRPDLTSYEELYKHLHAHPELSNQEHNTAAFIQKYLHQKLSAEFDIRANIGGTGIAALFHNGDGPTVLLRADFDALPVLEVTGLAYASKVRMRDADGVEKPVMHACGHDMHITCLLGAADLLVSCKDAWAGTLLLIFQPAEERGTGAQAMVDDGLYDPQRHAVPIPDICLGAHVTPMRAGSLATRRGLVASSADSMRVVLHGRGGHASQPHCLVDAVVMAAATVLRLQGIVAREVDPAEHAVVTVASIQAGDAENVVVDDARLAIDVRAMKSATRAHVLASVERIVRAESEASGAVRPPDIEPTRSFPLTINDEAATAELEKTFGAHFNGGADAGPYISDPPVLGFSEDFSTLATAVDRPASFFMYGGTDPELWDRCDKAGTVKAEVPSNHSGLFAPKIHPTLQTGLDAYAVGALTWLLKK
nr:thermostable carboxypeptidase 1 [Quercus suber]